MTFANTNSTSPSTFYVAGGIKISNGSATFLNGTYVLSSSDGTAGIDVAGGDSASFGNGSYNIAGGLATGGGSNLTFGSALNANSIFQIPTVGSSGNAMSTGGGNNLTIGSFTNVDLNGPVVIGGSSVTPGAGTSTVNGSVNMSNSGGGSITGTGVSVIASGAFSFGAGFNAVNISAPTAITTATDGQFSTIALASNSTSAFVVTAGASNTDVLGAIYAPNAAMTLSGSGNLNGGGNCLQLVTSSIALSGGGGISTTCTAWAAHLPPAPFRSCSRRMVMFPALPRKSGRAGVASLELALLSPVFLLFFTGVADFSMVYHQELQLASVLTAGGEYGFTSGQLESGSALTTDVTNFVKSLSGNSLSSITATYSNGLVAADYYCVSGSPATYTGPHASGASCTDGSTAGKFLAITGSFTYSVLCKADQAFVPKNCSQTVVIRLQ